MRLEVKEVELFPEGLKWIDVRTLLVVILKT